MKKEIIEHLLTIIYSCDLTIQHYRDYLNSGSKKIWDAFVINAMFVFNICRLHDEDLLDPKYDALLVQAVKVHDQLDKFLYPKKSEEVLTILHQIKEIMLPIILIHITEHKESLIKCRHFEYYKESYLKNADPKFYSLLQNKV